MPKRLLGTRTSFVTIAVSGMWIGRCARSRGPFRAGVWHRAVARGVDRSEQRVNSGVQTTPAFTPQALGCSWGVTLRCSRHVRPAAQHLRPAKPPCKSGVEQVFQLGRSQAVRQRILVPPCGGSNPPAPASRSHKNLAPLPPGHSDSHPRPHSETCAVAVRFRYGTALDTAFACAVRGWSSVRLTYTRAAAGMCQPGPIFRGFSRTEALRRLDASESIRSIARSMAIHHTIASWRGRPHLPSRCARQLEMGAHDAPLQRA